MTAEYDCDVPHAAAADADAGDVDDDGDLTQKVHRRRQTATTREDPHPRRNATTRSCTVALRRYPDDVRTTCSR